MTPSEGYASIKCPECGAEMGLYESTDFDGTESLWWGICPECGAEGETAERVKVVSR